jgi:hypothetical protein
MKPGIDAGGVAQTDLDHFGNGLNEGADPLRHGRLQ